MPGFNQRGPRNEGPMTGGARGLCNQNNPNDWQAQGFGRGRGMGRGRGACRWAGQGMAAGGRRDQATLEERLDTLEKELADARAQLKNKS